MKKIKLSFLLWIIPIVFVTGQSLHLDNINVEISANGVILDSRTDGIGLEFDSIYIPDTVNNQEIIGLSNFIPFGHRGISTIKRIRLPEKLVFIDDVASASISYSSIKTVDLPSNIRYIGSEVFKGNPCDGEIISGSPQLPGHEFMFWREIGFDGLGDTLQTGKIFRKSTAYIAQFKYLSKIPYELSKYDLIIYTDGRIRNCYYLGAKSLLLPDSIGGIQIHSIERKTFANREIENIKLPDCLLHIENGAFMNNKLQQIKIPINIKTINTGCFKNNLLSNVSTKHITAIKDRAFMNNLLEKIEFCDSLNHIGISAFQNNKLKSVKLPLSITYIGNKAFLGNDFSEKNIPILPSPKRKDKTFLYWQSFKKGKYNRETKSSEEVPVAQCQPGDKMDLNLGYKAVFEE